MPGFGHGPFGHMAFGEWWWSRYVLYDLIPAVYRDRDTEGFLDKFAESLRPSFDGLRRKIRDFGDIRDPLLVRAAASEQQVFRLGKRVIARGPIEQTGVDGKVLVYGEFTSNTARFTAADRGKELTIRRSSKPENNRSVTIVSVISATEVAVSPRLSLEPGPVRWNLRQVYADPPNQTTVEIRSGGVELGKVAGGWLLNDGFASYDIRDRKIFPVPADERELLTEREGSNGVIDSDGRLSTSTYQFSSLDIGKTVFIAGSSLTTNNGRFEILGVDALSPTDVRAVFSRLDLVGQDAEGRPVAAGSVRYANRLGQLARVRHVQTGLSTPLSVSVSGSDITVTLATNGLGAVTTTATALVAAVAAEPAADALVTAVATGSGAGTPAVLAEFVDVPGVPLAQDAALSWALLPFGRLVLRGPLPKGMVEVDGNDGFIQSTSATTATLRATTTAPFRAGDEGKLLHVRGSAVGNNGLYPVREVPVWGAGSVVVLEGAFASEPSGTTVFWELRTASANDSPLEVVASAPSMLMELAKDFGIEVDTQESEARQRSWVKYLNEWVDKKGLDRAYEILAIISGYSARVSALWGVSFEAQQQLPLGNTFEVTDFFGSDGSLSDAVGSEVTFTAPSAAFAPAHQGRYLRLQSAAVGVNNQLYEIIDWLSATSVRLRAPGVIPYALPVSPDANNGSLRWAVVRLYTDLSPLRPNFDDFDSDLMATLLPGFTVDLFCWEYPITLGVGGGGGSLSIVGVSQQADTSFLYVNGDIRVVTGLGLWLLTDAASGSAYLETTPEPVTSVALGAGNSVVTYFAVDPSYATPLRVAHVNPGPSNAVTTVAVAFGATTDITVSLRTDGAGVVLATAQEVVSALTQSTTASALVAASVYPGNGTGLAATAALTSLVSSGVFRTSIASNSTVALGAAGLEYVCTPQSSCDYCGSYRVIIELELDALFDENALGYERVFERTLERLKDVTPAHVQLIPRVVQPLSASWNWTATVEPVEILAELYAPWALVFDEFLPDAEISGTGDTIGGTAPSMTLTDAAALFTPALVGRTLILAGATSAANNGAFLITGYTSPTVITYTNAAGVAEAFTGSWGVVLYELDSPPFVTITTP